MEARSVNRTEAAAAAAAALSAPPPMREAEVRSAVEAEKLTLVPSNNKSGFKGVTPVANGRFQAKSLDGKQSYLGQFATALEAALHGYERGGGARSGGGGAADASATDQQRDRLQGRAC